MRTSISIIRLAAVCALITGAVSPAGAQELPFVDSQAIVRFAEFTLPDDADSMLGDLSVGEGTPLSDTATYLVHLPPGMSMDFALVALRQIPSVEYAGPNYLCALIEGAQMSQAFLDGDSEAHAAGVSPEEFYYQPAVGQVRMAEGHLVSTGLGHVVAHLDNGVDFDHPLLTGRLAANGYDFVDQDSNPSWEDGNAADHGTFAAGLIALSAPGATILPVRTLNSDGLGNVFTAAQGIEHAVYANASVIVMGFGLYLDDPILRNAVELADAHDIVVIASAGNDDINSPVFFPAGYSEVVGVGAVDEYDIKAAFSNFGVAVDVCAPGVSLYSSLPGGDTWGTWNGTSFAAPIVGGLAALMRSIKSEDPAFMLRTLLGWSSDSVDDQNPAYTGELGHGRVNFERALHLDDTVSVVWGHVTDGDGLPYAGVWFVPRKDGNPVVQSVAITDTNGYYASALPVGVYDFTFEDSTGSGLPSREYAAFSLTCDTLLNTSLNTGLSFECGAPGDVNQDGFADAIDLNALIAAIFFGGSLPDLPSDCPGVPGDGNCDGFADALDLNLLIDYIFFGGSPPAQSS
jgi:hypothetical protein